MHPKVEKLLKISQPEQLSTEWFKARENAITASSAASLMKRDRITCEEYVCRFDLQNKFVYDNKCCNPYSSRNQYFIDKCIGSKFKGSVATFHGQKYESVISDLYSNIKNTEILEFGLLKHPKYDFIAASPDGITVDGVAIEIKAPYRRKITGIPPLYYYIQVQIQLEVCDLETCDFVEMEFVEFITEQEWLDEETLEIEFIHRGLLIQCEKKNETGICNLEENTYIYPPREILDNIEDLLKWKNEKLNGNLNNKFNYILNYN
jgi:putative phage-type endonuclease